MKATVAALALSLAFAAACQSAPEQDLDPFDRGGPEPRASATTLHTLARMFAAQGRDGECEQALESLLAAHPDHAPGYNDLAALYLRHGRIQEAEVCLETGLERMPEDAVLLNNLGLCRLLRGDREAALASFTAASAAVPHDARSRANMALALGLLGRETEAEALYLQVLPPEDARHNLDVIATLRASPEGEAPRAAER